MNEQNNPPRQQQLPADNGNPVANDESMEKPTGSVPRRRRQRIREHLEEGLSNPAALEATLSCMSADLMTLEMVVGEAILKEARQRPLNLQDVDEQSPAISLLIRVVKQNVQVTQLGLQLARARLDRQQRKDELPPSEEI